MLKTYSYRLYPNKTQEQQLAQSFGTVRWIYNWWLQKKIEAYQATKSNVSYFALSKMIPDLKLEYEWIASTNAQSLQMSLRNLDSAFKSFFRKKSNFPSFKKKYWKKSMQFPQWVEIRDWNLKLPKIGIVKMKQDREFLGKIGTVTVSQTSTWKYMVSILVNTPDLIPNKPKATREWTIGIDLWLKDFATLSTGEKISNPKFLREWEARLKCLQRRLAKKVKWSANSRKARFALAKQHERIANQRKDFLHKLSTRLVSESQTGIAIEDLNVWGMMRNHCLAKSIWDASWRQFRTFLEYKCEWYGKNLHVIGRFEPSSRLCTCGFYNHDLTLKDREWTCPECKTAHDRDVLGANNIRNFAFSPSPGGKEPVEVWAIAWPMKQEETFIFNRIPL
jgi:putative transposase